MVALKYVRSTRKFSPMKKEKVVAVIPARGGSKGIENKNLRTVGGIPLVVRAVIAATKTESIDDVYVTTDSQEISKLASSAGAKVIIRPDAISGDHASSESALLHALEIIEEAEIVVFIQCTSPFLETRAVDEAVSLVKSGVADSVFSGVEDHGFFWRLEDGVSVAEGHNPQRRERRQDLPIKIRETGAFYVFHRKGLQESGSRFNGRVMHVGVSKKTVMDIDTQEDLELADMLSETLLERIALPRISALVMDFDGVHTNNYVYLNEHGHETVRLSRADGLGIQLLRSMGLTLAIMTSETNDAVRHRAEKLGVELYYGVQDKKKLLFQWCEDKKIPISEVAYVGNDLNDLEALRSCGFAIAVGDAYTEVLRQADLVLKSSGGESAIREIAEIFATGKFSEGLTPI